MKDYSEVFGYDELKDYIHKRIITKKVAHAILFVGDEGSGKRTIAKRFARTIQCETVEKKLDDNRMLENYSGGHFYYLNQKAYDESGLNAEAKWDMDDFMV